MGTLDRDKYLQLQTAGAHCVEVAMHSGNGLNWAVFLHGSYGYYRLP